MEKTKGGKGSTNHTPKKKPINEDIKVSVCLLFLVSSAFLQSGLVVNPRKLDTGEGGVKIKKNGGRLIAKGFVYLLRRLRNPTSE